MQYIGIDPSLTATGIARIDTDDVLVPQVRLIRTASVGDDYIDRWDRIQGIASDCILGLRSDDNPRRVIIEAPSLGQSRQSGTLDRHGLFWALIARCVGLDIPVLCVPPTVRAKYATGKGTADKGAVVDATARRCPHVETGGNNDLCDALWLAAIGAAMGGQPVVDLPQANQDALAKLTRPKGW